MKPSEIQVGKTYVSKNGKRRRIVLRMPFNQVVFTERPMRDKTDFHHNVLLCNFAKWAKEVVS